MNYWLVKQEPGSYPWHQFQAEKKTSWTGVRNFQARNHLRAMQAGDWVCYYHSGEEKQVVGLARVSRAHYPDPTATEGDWSSVDLEAVKALQTPVPLQVIKADKILQEMPLVRQSRLSVLPLTKVQFDHVLALAETKL